MYYVRSSFPAKAPLKTRSAVYHCLHQHRRFPSQIIVMAGPGFGQTMLEYPIHSTGPLRFSLSTPSFPPTLYNVCRACRSVDKHYPKTSHGQPPCLPAPPTPSAKPMLASSPIQPMISGSPSRRHLYERYKRGKPWKRDMSPLASKARASVGPYLLNLN